MPKITIQRPPASNGVKPSIKGGILSRIAPIQVTEGIKLNVYGRTKTGKTRLACTFPKPLLLIGTEDGTKSVSGVKGAEFVRIYESEELDALTEHVKEKKPLRAGVGPARTVVLDHGSGLQDIILKEILGLKEIPIQRNWGMAQRDHWMACGAQWKERVRTLLDLADRQGLCVVIIAHERNFGEEGQTNDVIFPSVGSALTPSAAGWLDGACDYICQTFIRAGEKTEKVKIAGKETEIKRPTGKNEYCLRVGSHPVYKTGFRVPAGLELPDFIVDPNFEKINSLIHGKSI